MKYSLGLPIVNTSRLPLTLDVNKQVFAYPCQKAVTVMKNSVVPATFSSNVATITSTDYYENDSVVLWASCIVAYSSCATCTYNKYK